MKTHIILVLKGMAMGAANVIPGVSGGTIAFITGIYERLLNALKSFDLSFFQLFFKGRFKEIAIKTDIVFLAAVFLGVFISILSLAKVMKWAFEFYEVFTLSFFFGLIIASIWAVGRQVNVWSVGTVVAFVLGTLIAVSISFLPPAQPNEGFFYVTLCGVVAVCSMILPGLSGSYILLLMGNYVLVLQAISAFDFKILTPLLIGVVAGLILFSRLLSYLFAHYRDVTIALLSGFVSGSLLLIWPWKQTTYATYEGKEKAIGYVWQLPILDSSLITSCLFILAGFLLVWLIEKGASSTK